MAKSADLTIGGSECQLVKFYIMAKSADLTIGGSEGQLVKFKLLGGRTVKINFSVVGMDL